MRNSVLALALAVLSSCATVPWKGGGVAASDARESVYRVDVTLTVDITPLLPPEPDNTGKEEKNVGTRIPHAISDAGGKDLRDFKLIELREKTADIGWVGTGWVAAKRNGNSYLMTAGHVCESGDFFELEYFDWETFEMRTVQLPIIKKVHKVVSRDNIETEVTVLADEDLNADGSGPDMCLTAVHGDFGPVLPLATEDPGYAEHAAVIGAPTGLWGGGIAPTADLKFSGRGNIWGGKIETSLAFTGDVAGGNSGSAIMQDGKVVALLNFGGRRFKELTTGIPWDVLQDFLRRNLHQAPKKH